MEQQLAEYMMRFAKFEFFLMRVDPGFVQKNKENRVTGVQWDMLANEVEKVFPWATFDFDNSGFAIFKDQPPQYLIIREDHSLDWDGDADPVDDWSKLLTKSFAQFRNNIAHGSKGNPPRPFTHGRTPVFLAAGHNLMNFLPQVFLMAGIGMRSYTMSEFLTGCLLRRVTLVRYWRNAGKAG